MQYAHFPRDLLGANYNEVDSVSTSGQQTGTNFKPRFQTGAVSAGSEGSEYMYVRFASAVTEAQFVVISYNGTDSVFEATAITTTNADAKLGQMVGIVAASAGAASGEYGWVQRKGRQKVLVAQNCAINAQLNTTATAGVADDDGTAASTYINGVVLVTAAPNTTGPHKAEAFINYPVLGTEDPS